MDKQQMILQDKKAGSKLILTKWPNPSTDISKPLTTTFHKSVARGLQLIYINPGVEK